MKDLVILWLAAKSLLLLSVLGHADAISWLAVGLFGSGSVLIATGGVLSKWGRPC